jgi:hypothetical protein
MKNCASQEQPEKLWAEVGPPHKAGELDEHFNLPLSIGEWGGSEVLLEWIEAEVEKLEWGGPEFLQYLQEHPEYRPKVMLALLAFSYATQVFESREIVGRCETDRVCRLICEGRVPSGQELRRFRRRNRNLLETLLARVVLRALRVKFDLDAIQIPSELERDLHRHAVVMLDVARHLDNAG